MNTAQSIFSTLLQEKQALQKFGVARIGIFGSSMRAETTDANDIDMMVEFAPQKKTYRNFLSSSRDTVRPVFSRSAQ